MTLAGRSTSPKKQEAEAAFAQQEQDLGQKEDEYNVNKAALDLEKRKAGSGESRN